MTSKDDLLDITPDDFPIRTLRPLQSKDLVVAESHRVSFYVRLQPGQTLDECLTFDYWKLVGRRLHPGALIELEPADQSWWALLLCREASAEHARVALLMHVPLEPLYGATVDDLMPGVSVQFMGPARLWAVLRATQILKHSFSTKSDAIQWAQEAL